MIRVVLIMWLIGPIVDDIDGKIAKVGPVVVLSYSGATAQATCDKMLERMKKTSAEKVEGKCVPWE